MKMPLLLIWISDDIPEIATLKKNIISAAKLNKKTENMKWSDLTTDEKEALMVEHYSEEQLKVIKVEDIDEAAEAVQEDEDPIEGP